MFLRLAGFLILILMRTVNDASADLRWVTADARRCLPSVVPWSVAYIYREQREDFALACDLLV